MRSKQPAYFVVCCLQVESRLKMASHWYHVQGLNERVSNYSIVELLVMCASPIVQVTLLRRLFSYRSFFQYLPVLVENYFDKKNMHIQK